MKVSNLHEVKAKYRSRRGKSEGISSISERQRQRNEVQLTLIRRDEIPKGNGNKGMLGKSTSVDRV